MCGSGAPEAVMEHNGTLPGILAKPQLSPDSQQRLSWFGDTNNTGLILGFLFYYTGDKPSSWNCA